MCWPWPGVTDSISHHLELSCIGKTAIPLCPPGQASGRKFCPFFWPTEHVSQTLLPSSQRLSKHSTTELHSLSWCGQGTSGSAFNSNTQKQPIGSGKGVGDILMPSTSSQGRYAIEINPSGLCWVSAKYSGVSPRTPCKIVFSSENTKQPVTDSRLREVPSWHPSFLPLVAGFSIAEITV